MSRIGRKPVALPEKVQVDLKDGRVTVSGPLGSLTETMPQGVAVTVEGNLATLSSPSRNRRNRGFQGLGRALLANMVEGVTKGYERSLEISGVGYKAELQGDVLQMVLGYTHPVRLKLPQGIKAELNKPGTAVKISGIDKQLVGQVAAQLRAFKIPEPYKAKGVKYADETIRRKAGKAGVT